MPADIVTLPHDEIPQAWYNVLADLPAPLPPPLHPGTGRPSRAAKAVMVHPTGSAPRRTSSTSAEPARLRLPAVVYCTGFDADGEPDRTTPGWTRGPPLISAAAPARSTTAFRVTSGNRLASRRGLT